MTANRKGRKMFEKALKVKVERLVPVNQGDCFVCQDRVYAAPGQVIRMYDGQPLHKACRKRYPHL